MKCKLKDVKPKSNTAYVGNFKLKHDKADQLLDYFIKKKINIILTLEGDKSEEHIHFYIPELLLKVETIKKQLRELFPSLKRPTLIDENGNKKKGGAVLTCIKILKQNLQYYYIYKEYNPDKDKFYLSNFATPYSHKTLKKLKQKYDLYKEGGYSGKKGKFLYWLLDTEQIINDPVQLGLLHLVYQKKFNETYVTIHNTIATVNYVLMKCYPQKLQDHFLDLLQKKYLSNNI